VFSIEDVPVSSGFVNIAGVADVVVTGIVSGLAVSVALSVIGSVPVAAGGSGFGAGLSVFSHFCAKEKIWVGNGEPSGKFFSRICLSFVSDSTSLVILSYSVFDRFLVFRRYVYLSSDSHLNAPLFALCFSGNIFS